ncbi:hypothetical protein LMG33818_001874 [Halomonadaceae bacterium LMG 33818]|uniref:hypothetical protein n=1 Tax=Cernens ardua TaxID=3402176 RepID=UPI003EDBF978
MTIIECILAILTLVLVWKYQPSREKKLPPAAQAIVVLLLLLVAFSRITEASYTVSPTHDRVKTSSMDTADTSGFIIGIFSTQNANAPKNVKSQQALGEKTSPNDDDDENNLDDDDEDTFSDDEE